MLTELIRLGPGEAPYGIITLHKIPDKWSDDDFRYWFCPVTAPNGQILQPARISDETKQAWLVSLANGDLFAKNLITNNGISQLLTNHGVQAQSSMQPFSQILAVGNGSITGVTRADTTLPGDGFATNSRKTPASHANTGFSVTITTNFASGDAVGTWTSVAFFGGGSATTTSGTGTMETHALFSFVKGSTSYAANYVFLYSN
jgi:hypothetical protein